MQFLNRYYSTFVEGPQCKYKQLDAYIVLSCQQQKCYIFVNIDENNLFEILLLRFTSLIFSLVFNHFLVIFQIFFSKYTLTYVLTDSSLCLDRTSDTLAIDWDWASHIRKLFWLFGRTFPFLYFLIYDRRTCSIKRTVSFSLLKCFSLYDKQKTIRGINGWERSLCLSFVN